VTRRGRFAAALAVAVSLTLAVAGCAPQAGSIPVDETTVVLDVRTPGEFAEGHLDGAVNLDVQAADFDARAAELDPDADYVVYCRSGNRAGTAITRLSDLGFDSLVNAGSLSAASTATGLPVVD